MFDVSVQKWLIAYQNIFIFFQSDRNKPILVIHKRLLAFKVCLIAGLIKDNHVARYVNVVKCACSIYHIYCTSPKLIV